MKRLTVNQVINYKAQISKRMFVRNGDLVNLSLCTQDADSNIPSIDFPLFESPFSLLNINNGVWTLKSC